MSTLAYLKSFISDKDVASVTPTSKWCVDHVCKPIDFSKDLHIVEYGAGAGVFANYLLSRLSPQSTLTMFETNDRLFDKLQSIGDRRANPCHQNVEQVDQVLPNEQIGQVDYVISGIPFSFLDASTQISVLEKTKTILKSGGQFLAYQTSGHLKEPLMQTFGNYYTEWEWRNIPPMTVYKSLKK